MSDFQFEIVGDAGKANQAISSLETQLQRLTSSAAVVNMRLKDAIGGNDSFARAALSARKATSEQNDQLKRQADMLQRLHGPALNHQADMKAIEALYRLGKISASEYTAEIARMQTAMAKPIARPAPVVSGGGGGAMGSLKSAAAVAGVGIGVKELADLSGEYQNLQNRLRYIAGGDQAKVNDLFARTSAIAKETRSDLGATTEAFVRMTGATKQMGLTTSEVLSFTSHLNKAVKLSGATSSESAAGVMQLSQALASGRLQGDEFKSINESMPGVLDIVAKSMGVSKGALKELSSQGAITAEVIVKAFQQAGPEIDKAFGQTVPTLADSFVGFKNSLIETVGELDKNTGASKAVGAALGVVGDVVGVVTGFFKLMDAAFGKAGIAAIGLGAAIAAGLGPLGAAIVVLEGVKYAADKLTASLDAEMIAQTKINNRMAEVNEAYSKEMQAVSAAADAIHSSAIAHSALWSELHRVAEALAAGEVLIQKNADEWVKAAAEVDGYTAAVAQVVIQANEMAKLSGKAAKIFLTAADVKLIYDARDAQQKLTDMASPYGKVLQDIHTKENNRRRGIEQLKGALAAGAITQAEYNDAIKQYLPHADKAHKKHLDIMKVVRDSAAAQDAAAKSVRLYWSEIHDVDDAVYSLGEKAKETTRHLRSMFEDQAGLDRWADKENDVMAVLKDVETPMEKYEETMVRLNALYGEGAIGADIYARAKAKAWDPVAKEQAEAEKKLHEQLTKSWEDRLKAIQNAKKSYEELGQVFAPLGSALVDAFKQGEISAKKFEDVLTEIAIKLALMGLVSGIGGNAGAFLGGALGIPGHATGAQFMVGGAGGTDNNLVAFRASNNERVTVETPQQQRDGTFFGGGGSGDVAIVNQYQDDPRAIRQSMSGYEGRRVIYNQMRRLPGSRRS